jgi:hypothetical protein
MFALIAKRDVGKFKGVNKLNLVNVLRSTSAVSFQITPTQLLNLSLIAGVLAPRGSRPQKSLYVRVRGPYKLKVIPPRPNPEVRNITMPVFTETPALPYPGVNGSTTLQVYRRDWTGSTTPGFGKVKGLQLPDNPHTVQLHKTDYSMGYDLRRTYANPDTTYNNGWRADTHPFSEPAFIPTFGSEFDGVSNAAVKKLNANANLGVQANMAQNLAQYTQTTNMISQNAKRIAASMLALRKGQFSQAANLLVANDRSKSIRKGQPSKTKSLANNWLELQYGWKPLLSDIDESMRILASYMQNSQGSKQVRGSASINKSWRVPQYHSGGVPPSVGNEYLSQMWQCKFVVRYRVSSHLTSSLAQFGFTNPINLVWEILPYSFVVDWFLPIGPYLESLSAPHGVEFVSGCKTLFSRRDTQMNVAYHGPYPGSPTSELRKRAERSRLSVTLVRSKLTAYPTQTFPQFKNPFSTVHVANAIALVRQAFGRR